LFVRDQLAPTQVRGQPFGLAQQRMPVQSLEGAVDRSGEILAGDVRVRAQHPEQRHEAL
jgi:hypothetical protein